MSHIYPAIFGVSFLPRLTIGVASAILSFNKGAHGIVDVMKRMNMDPGCCTLAFCSRSDTMRIKHMGRKMSDKGKRQRKKRRAIRKGFQVEQEEKEGEIYGSGAF